MLVVDSDLRRPGLHNWFELPNDVGLADFLGGGKSLDDVIQESPIEGVSVIASGGPTPDPAKLFSSEKMKVLISTLKKQFDLVILDSAPLLVKSDALVLSKYVDGSIVVVESGKTTIRAASELIDMLTKADIDILGFILNKFEVEKGKYDYHQYYHG